MLNDELWSKLREIMLQHGIYDKPNLRMIVKKLEILSASGHPFQLSQERVILRLATQTWIGVFTNIGIWLKTSSPG
jgi:hypothetical protein